MKKEEKQTIIDNQGSEFVIEKLQPYVTAQRQERINAVLSGRLQGIQLAIEAPSDINNALAAVRSSEALGVATVHIICPEGDASFARTITQGAIYWVDVVFHASFTDFLQHMHTTDVQLVGGTVDATMSLSAIPIEKPICILLGNEQRGLSLEAQKACNLRYKIPMYGMTESFNLSVAAALSLYDTTTRRRVWLGHDSDLTPSGENNLRAQYYFNSVASRLARALLYK